MYSLFNSRLMVLFMVMPKICPRNVQKTFILGQMLIFHTLSRQFLICWAKMVILVNS